MRKHLKIPQNQGLTDLQKVEDRKYKIKNRKWKTKDDEKQKRKRKEKKHKNKRRIKKEKWIKKSGKREIK